MRNIILLLLVLFIANVANAQRVITINNFSTNYTSYKIPYDSTNSYKVKMSKSIEIPCADAWAFKVDLKSIIKKMRRDLELEALKVKYSNTGTYYNVPNTEYRIMFYTNTYQVYNPNGFYYTYYY